MPPLLQTDVLVVPPLEAVWLSGTEFQLQDGRGCLSFEVKGNRAMRAGGNIPQNCFGRRPGALTQQH